ncbi:MAG TPA: ATP-binding protein, partial [Pirellulales bacterium]|nr:ATP-binding protein [Pirellulales bacterium]
FGEGSYLPDARQRVYAKLMRRAESRLRGAISVVLDGTFSSSQWLQESRQLAVNQHCIFLAVECRCDPDVARHRIGKRLRQGGDSSEMRPELYRLQAAAWEPWPHDEFYVDVDTQQPLELQMQQCLSKLKTAARQRTHDQARTTKSRHG